jgi:hypothetical protein
MISKLEGSIDDQVMGMVNERIDQAKKNQEPIGVYDH